MGKDDQQCPAIIGLSVNRNKAIWTNLGIKMENCRSKCTVCQRIKENSAFSHPSDQLIRDLLLYCFRSVCLSICLSIHLHCNFWCIQDIMCVIGYLKYIAWFEHFQMTSMWTPVWPWPYDLVRLTGESGNWGKGVRGGGHGVSKTHQVMFTDLWSGISLLWCIRKYSPDRQIWQYHAQAVDGKESKGENTILALIKAKQPESCKTGQVTHMHWEMLYWPHRR